MGPQNHSVGGLAHGLQETGWERSLPGQPRALPHSTSGEGAPFPPTHSEQVPLPTGPPQGLPGRLLGISGSGRGRARQQPQVFHNCFSTWSFQGAAGSQAGGSGEPRQGAGGDFSHSVHGRGRHGSAVHCHLTWGA